MPSFFTAYVNEALRTNTDDYDRPLSDNYGITAIASDTLGRMKEDADLFQRANFIVLRGLDANQAGRDFWLTRNGHGAGFWDGDYEDAIGERLTTSAESFGPFDLYIGDDGQIHGTGGKIEA